MAKFTHTDVASVIREAALKKNCHPSEITKRDIQNINSEITDWSLKLLGGIEQIKKSYFPIEQKALEEIQEAKEVSSYISKLEKKVSERKFFEKALLDAVEENIISLPKIKPKSISLAPSKQSREVVMMLNDTHYGLIVDPEEIGDVNSFGWTQACRRTAMMVKEAITYKLHHKEDIKKCHLVLNGDLIQGIIHGLSTRTMELSIHQVNGAVHILSHAISHLALRFDSVEVHGIAGNHEDKPHKREHGKRVCQEKYDSYSNIIFYALSAAFRNSEHVTFNVPKTPYVFFNLPAGRAMANHGDTLFSRALGNPGRAINVKSLSDEIRKFNAGEIAKGREPVKLMLFGHTHSYAHFITQDGVEVYCAPSLSGVDGYAHSLNINTNLIGQVMFESTDKFILGDSRLIRLLEADLDTRYDELIPVFENTLKWSKK